MHVIGTAGHVDHGKSTLIKALTGIDPDRLREEKERQMTIDLGFAWLDLPSGEEIGIVDVPGHRDFIDNMLAGAGGIDAVLFIIAADEGIMPQSREHLAILKLLEIKSGLIVLTKVDLIDDQEWLDLIKSDIRQFTANSFLTDAPMIGVSAITGKGLDELKISIDEMVQNCEPKQDIKRARLPIDRVFSIKGFGTVVTGTMLDGVFSVGQQIEILPSHGEARIRGLQSHKKKLDRTEPGGRTAVNLTGIDLDDIQRGNVLAEPGIYSPSTLVDVRFSMLTDASGDLKHNDEVKVFLGSAQSLARVRLIKSQKLKPGESGWLQLDLTDEMVVARGDHYILRRPSPAETMGGGVVLDTHPGKRHKRFSQTVYDHFAMLETGSLKDQILDLIRVKQPVLIKEIIENSGMDNNRVLDELSDILESEAVLINSTDKKINNGSLIILKSRWDKDVDRIFKLVSDYQKKHPLRAGISKNELKESLGWNTDLVNSYIEGLIIRGLIKQNAGLVSMPDYQVIITSELEKEFGKVKKAFQLEPFAPPPLSEIKEIFGSDLVSVMIANHLLIVTSEDIAFTREDFDLMVRKLVEFTQENGGITLGQFRDLFNTSRKYALSLLEYLDKIGATSFDGEKRVIRNIDKLLQ